jgi:hypothetical protein
MLTRNLRSLFLVLALAQGTALLAVDIAAAQEVTLPATAAEHEATAKKYREEAASYRKNAAEHKKMADAYAKEHAKPKTGSNPYIVKMQKHCAALVADYEKLATDAEKMAEYHTLRAKEEAGK